MQQQRDGRAVRPRACRLGRGPNAMDDALVGCGERDLLAAEALEEPLRGRWAVMSGCRVGSGSVARVVVGGELAWRCVAGQKW